MRARFAATATLLLVAATACAASGAAGAKPTLSVSRGKLHGTHFAAREVVRVTIVRSGEGTTRRMRTSAAGTFATALPSDKCLGTIVVMVRGATGDNARMKIRARECAPALKQPGS